MKSTSFNKFKSSTHRINTKAKDKKRKVNKNEEANYPNTWIRIHNKCLELMD